MKTRIIECRTSVSAQKVQRKNTVYVGDKIVFIFPHEKGNPYQFLNYIIVTLFAEIWKLKHNNLYIFYLYLKEILCQKFKQRLI